MKQKLTELKGEVDNLTMIVGDFNILVSTMDRKLKQKINKEIEDLSNIINKLNLADICRIVSLTTADNTFSSSTRETFSRINHGRL